MKSIHSRTFPALLSAFALAVSARADTVVTYDAPELAGISGFRGHWDRPFVLSETGPQKVTDAKVKDRGGSAVWQDGSGAAAFDALNRSLLVRFPDCADKIAAELAKGNVITKAEVVLPFRDEELWPPGAPDFPQADGYNFRQNWGVDDLYRALRPRWHAVAWELRRPWIADAQNGPTYNAAVNGAIYWTKFGAEDTDHDRFAQHFGPTEVSYKQPEGRLNVTDALLDARYGATLAGRLRSFADCGIVVRKQETYDAMYYTGAYEWATATGGRAILVNKPSLVITFAPGQTLLGAALSPAANIPTLAAASKANGTGGDPTAIMPTATQLAQLANDKACKPAWMPDWQWARVRELESVERPDQADQPFWFQFVDDWMINRISKSHWDKGVKVMDVPPDPAAVYAMWVDLIVGRQPRGWSGFESARQMSQWYLYHDALPGPAQDAVKRYWTAWLMPDRQTVTDDKARRSFETLDGRLVHPMVDDPRVGGPDAKWPDPLHGRFDTYYAKTGDWRGNKSFFRSGFCWDMSTQNFNSTSSAGALLGGALIDSNLAMADGRHGAETFPLRMWTWDAGSGQEHIDHYYFSISLAGNKAIADFSATPYDRLLGQSLLAKDVEELVSAYHPGLRSFIAGSSRTGLDHVVGTQNGINFVMDTLSRQGALRNAGEMGLPDGIEQWGQDAAPHLIAQETLTGPWAPDWVAPMVDDKPLPYEAKHNGWNGARRTCYMGLNYGLASNATQEARIQIMAQWRGQPTAVARMQDLSTLDMRLGVNDTQWQNVGQGHITQFGTMSALQHRNKLIALMHPYKPDAGKTMSLQSSIGLFNFHEPAPTWQFYVDGQKVAGLPFTCKQGQRITMDDGVTYLGIVPIPCTNLGRDAEVVFKEGTVQKPDFYGSRYKAALQIDSYYYKGDKAIGDAVPNLDAAIAKAYGGFAVEFADKGDYHSFADFQAHMNGVKLEVAYDDPSNTVVATYVSGKDTLEAASVLKDTSNLSVALVNGKSPYLPEGIERDTPYCQQGFVRLEKNGAILEGDAGHRLFLLTEPKGRVYCGWNPLPDLIALKMTAPGGLQVASDGKVGLARIVIRPATNAVEIDQAYKPGQESEPGAASALLITGVKSAPQVILNGSKLSKLGTRKVGGQQAYVVPLVAVKGGAL